MSWQMALMVASTAVSAVQGMQQARAAEQQALIEGQIATENALAAETQALREEADRRRIFEELQASNRNAAGYDPSGSQSFLALEKRNELDMIEDVDAIRYGGAHQSRNLELTRDAQIRNAKSARSQGQLALLKGAVDAGTTIGKYAPGRTTPTTASSNLMTPGGSAGFYQGR